MRTATQSSGPGSCRPLPDVHSPQVRSHNMARIRRTNTRPELIIRSGLHRLGWRFRLGEKYRLRNKFLPGKPDLVFPVLRAVIFVNGCFWHGHNCSLFRWPATREEFWRAKITGNIARDQRIRKQLAEEGWRVLDIWECALKGSKRWPIEAVISECADFLDSDVLLHTIGISGTVAVG